MAPIHEAASANDVAALVACLEAGSPPSALFRERGNTTPLHAAAMAGSLDVVRYLLDVCGVDVDEQDGGDRTALFWSVIALDKGAVGCFLLRRGANPSLPDKRGYTALMQAAAYGRLRLIRALLKDPRVDPDARPCSDEGGQVYYGFPAIVHAGEGGREKGREGGREGGSKDAVL